jgi:hypothetical protein
MCGLSLWTERAGPLKNVGITSQLSPFGRCSVDNEPEDKSMYICYQMEHNKNNGINLHAQLHCNPHRAPNLSLKFRLQETAWETENYTGV